MDPVSATALLNTKKDDFSNAEREYDFSEQHTISCLSRLRGAEKEYEEAVALFEEEQDQQKIVDSSEENVAQLISENEEMLAVSAGEVSECKNIHKENELKESENKNTEVYAQVISYIFNGGAVALILPTGLFRKKEIIV